ncbi:vacuolar protein sorting-associated protein 72 homolog [Rhinoraja longicauda]
MSLAETRAPRSNAGGRLWRLLQAEEEDHFYSTTYGGFQEESGDEEYNTEQSDSEDEVDSDFDIDEGDEPDSAPDDEEPRRKRRVITKVYKEPVKPTRSKPRVRKLPGGAGAPEKVSTETGDLADTPDDSADRVDYFLNAGRDRRESGEILVQDSQNVDLQA